MKHRTQILLEDWQYQALKSEAAQSKKSFSSLIREGIEHVLSARGSGSRKALQAFCGIIKDKRPPLANHEMDQLIYRVDWK